MRIKDIEKVPVIFTAKGDCDRFVALALRSAMKEGQDSMQLMQRVISDNIEHLSDKALEKIIREIDNSPFKESSGDTMTTICVRVLREQQRRRDYGD